MTLMKKLLSFIIKNTLQKTLETLKSPKEDDANEKAIEFYNKNALQKIIKALETQETQEDETIQEEDEPKISENIKINLKISTNKIRRNLAITKQIQDGTNLKLKLKALQEMKANKELQKKEEEERLAREERQKEERLAREKEEKRLRKDAEKKYKQ